MRGFAIHDGGPDDATGTLAEWEGLVVDAVGNVIEFWGFKRNQGRVWALLYLRGRPLSAAEIQEELGISKGAVSMVTRELEGWGVVRRARAPADAVWRFIAEVDLMRMIRRVLKERESSLVSRVREDLEHAERLAKDARVPAEVMQRVKRMRTLAAMMDKALHVFLETARLDVVDAVAVLTEVDERAGKRTTKNPERT
jgi:HTH-type transcriptional regulator, glycine betaine synthesis regulator